MFTYQLLAQGAPFKVVTGSPPTLVTVDMTKEVKAAQGSSNGSGADRCGDTTNNWDRTNNTADIKNPLNPLDITDK